VSLQSELYIRSTRPPEVENETMSDLTKRMSLSQFGHAEHESENRIALSLLV